VRHFTKLDFRNDCLHLLQSSLKNSIIGGEIADKFVVRIHLNNTMS